MGNPSLLRATAAFALLLAPFACSGNATNNYPAAGVALGSVVGASVAYRAVSGNCLAVCSAGYVCDRPSGMCVPHECSPACPDGQQCLRDRDGELRCEDYGLTSSLLAARRAPPSSDAGPDALMR